VQDIMLKCDMCYDRTSIGQGPMCATVCPSGALAFRTREDILEHRRETPINVFNIGPQKVTTKVQMMMPENTVELQLDVASLLPESKQTEGTIV